MRKTLGRSSGVFNSGNVLAGISVGAYLIPQAMAYGSLAGVEPSVSLSISAIPLIVYMILGRSVAMSLGPESAVALMAAAAVAPVAAAYGVPAGSALALAAILVGIILGAGWLLKASFLADLLSKPILTGYMTGVAVLMILSQLPKFVGYDVDSSGLGGLFATEWALPNWQTALIVTVVVVISLVSRAISPRVPGPLLGLAVAIVMGIFMDVPKVGPVSLELPIPDYSSFSIPVATALLLPALSIAIVSYTDVMVTSRAFGGNRPPDPGSEMRALAVVQTATGAVGGYPMSASSSRTALAKASGAKTRFYSIFVLMVLLSVPLLIPGVIAAVPEAGLAGVIIFAAITLIEIGVWFALAKFRKREVSLAVVCTVSVLILGILPGVVVAIILSIAEFLGRLARPHEGVLGFTPGVAGMHDVDDSDKASTIPGLVVFRYDAPLFFMNATDFRNKVEGVVEPDTKVLLLNMEANVEADTTALSILQDVHDKLKDDGVDLWLARVKNDLVIPMTDHGVAEVIGFENMYPTLPVALEAFEERFPQ